MALLTLVDHIQQAVASPQTVGIYFNWTERGEYRAGFMLFSQHRLFRFAVHDQSGTAAVAMLRQIKPQRLFVWDFDTPAQPDAGLPPLAEVLEMLGAEPIDDSAAVQLPSDIDPDTLMERTQMLVMGVQAIFGEWLGAESYKTLQTIAQMCPPELRPLEFLDRCQKAIEPKAGKAKAEQIFKALRLSLVS